MKTQSIFPPGSLLHPRPSVWVTADVSSVLLKGMEMEGSEVSQGELRGFQKYIQCWFAGARRGNGGPVQTNGRDDVTAP